MCVCVHLPGCTGVLRFCYVTMSTGKKFTIASSLAIIWEQQIYTTYRILYEDHFKKYGLWSTQARQSMHAVFNIGLIVFQTICMEILLFQTTNPNIKGGLYTEVLLYFESRHRSETDSWLKNSAVKSESPIIIYPVICHSFCVFQFHSSFINCTATG